MWSYSLTYHDLPVSKKTKTKKKERKKKEKNKKNNLLKEMPFRLILQNTANKCAHICIDSILPIKCAKYILGVK